MFEPAVIGGGKGLGAGADSGVECEQLFATLQGGGQIVSAGFEPFVVVVGHGGFPGVDGGGIVVFSSVGRGRFAGRFSIFAAWRLYPPLLSLRGTFPRKRGKGIFPA